mmetsp:Transcript_37274/g.110064  ORF Transcript_37274/g.110064 Transcript_37274/m.110064 type:complete len:213 (-) Transcript_37274:203-841(-)
MRRSCCRRDMRWTRPRASSGRAVCRQSRRSRHTRRPRCSPSRRSSAASGTSRASWPRSARCCRARMARSRSSRWSRASLLRIACCWPSACGGARGSSCLANRPRASRSTWGGCAQRKHSARQRSSSRSTATFRAKPSTPPASCTRSLRASACSWSRTPRLAWRRRCCRSRCRSFSGCRCRRRGDRFLRWPRRLASARATLKWRPSCRLPRSR